jgi:hypothetical protein
MTSGSSMLAITLSLPPQPAQVLIWTPNTRFRRCAQVMASRAAVSAMRRPPHEGQNPRFLQLNATSFSAWQPSQRTRRNPSSSRPHFR